jgi:hypothetical protein
MIHAMLWSWRDWRLPGVRWIHLGVCLAAGILSLALWASPASALIGALVAAAVVGVLELWFRRRHHVGAPDK